ncbi:MAG: TRIC cation channel family protein [Candidatus Nanopelagicales bacterium]
MSAMIHAVTWTATESTPFIVLAVVGTMAFSISGVMAAARAQMDWLGAVVLALAVAIGGGTIRDLLLGQLPVAWLERTWPVLLAIGTAVLMLIISDFGRKPTWKHRLHYSLPMPSALAHSSSLEPRSDCKLTSTHSLQSCLVFSLVLVVV